MEGQLLDTAALCIHIRNTCASLCATCTATENGPTAEAKQAVEQQRDALQVVGTTLTIKLHLLQ